jgi:hypothetical protein
MKHAACTTCARDHRKALGGEPMSRGAAQAIANRCRQRVKLMQVEVDGRGLAEAPRKAKPPFLESAHLIAGFNADGDALVWFAVWNESRNLAIAVDVTSDEVQPYEHALRNAHRAWGDNYAGPFPSRRQAIAFAVEKLVEERKERTVTLTPSAFLDASKTGMRCMHGACRFAVSEHNL